MSFRNKIYFYAFFSEFIPILALYALYFSTNDISLSGITLLFLFSSLSRAILELPSGVLGDRFKRKNILLVSQLIKSLGFTIWLVQPNFIGFAIGFILWGMARAFESGTLQAYIYDELLQNNQEARYEEIIGGLTSITLISILLGGGLASLQFFLWPTYTSRYGSARTPSDALSNLHRNSTISWFKNPTIHSILATPSCLVGASHVIGSRYAG